MQNKRQKNSEGKRSLSESQQRYEQMANTIPVMLYDSILMPDETSRFIYVAPEPCRTILELDPDALLKDMSLVWAIVHPDDATRFYQEDVTANKSGKEFLSEVRIITHSGRLKWLLVNSKPNPAVPGEPVVWSGYLQDITEQKQAEKELQRREKLESVGLLAGGIAHDFNNALTGLYGNVALAKMKLANDHPAFRFLEAAEQSMLRTTLLTNRLLTFAKGGDPHKENLSLVSLIEEVVNLSLSGSNIKPVVTSVANLSQVTVDQRQMQQVFANLTLNAREATPDGGHLYITIENTELADKTVHGLIGGEYLQITVTDQGTGIEQKLLDKIFDPYFTTKEMGSGLGLATVYSIIDKHGGHISVTSQFGKGTTFTIYLPANEVVEDTPLTQSGMTQVPLTQGTKILVMDDEETICSMLNEMLGTLGFVVETAVEGQQAIDMYQQAMNTGKPFETVILDLTIPGGMGGQEAAKGILQIDSEAKIIVSSGYADDPVIANYAGYGFKGVATKPYSLNKLSGVLA